jgi:hypothetical protein
MTTTDLKIAFINVITLGFNFMQIDLLLKIVAIYCIYLPENLFTGVFNLTTQNGFN